MSNKSRISVSISLLCITHFVLSMDDPHEKKAETPKIYPQIPVAATPTVELPSVPSMNSTGSLSNSSGLYNSGSYSWSFNPVSFVTGLVSSAATTVHNKLSDDAALKKVGYPITDTYAQSELTKCFELYKNLLEPKNKTALKENLERIQRRTEYLTRIFCILPDRPDFDDIIMHCNKHHQRAMSVFLKDWYQKFLEKKLNAYNQLSEEIKQLNTSQDYKPQLTISSSSASTDSHSLQLTIPTFACATQYLWDGASSLYNTAKNELSDIAAFQKLGWPIHDITAQQELNITMQNYNRVMEAHTREKCAEELSFVLRRTEYLVRAYLALPHMHDAFEFAQHLMKYHQRAMFPLLLQLFMSFTQDKHEDLRLKKNEILPQTCGAIAESKISFNFGKLTNKNAEEIKQSLGRAHCVLLKQIHSINGFVMTEETRNIEMLSQAADFVITNMRFIKLGVLTADCLPILFNDTKNKAIGIAHAGWRGSVDNISRAVLESMQRNYQTKSEDVSIVFGPCIHACCYKVGQELISRVKIHSFGEKTIMKRGGDQFFDLLAFNKALLVQLGVKENAIDSRNSVCTACNQEYHSHRREGELAGRQLSTVWIE